MPVARKSRFITRQVVRLGVFALTAVAACLAGPLVGRCAEAAAPEWVDAMRAVHVRGGWTKGSVSQIGDSITYTKAFLAPAAWEKPEGFPAVAERIDFRLINQRKGPEFGNYSGWTAGQGREKVAAVLAAEKPELAVIMYGTNEITKGVSLEEYEKNMAAIIDACLAAGCVPILSTIPPYPNRPGKAEAINEVVGKLARDRKLPLVDFHAAIVARRPGDSWNGTLLGKNDVHPTGGKNLDFSDDNLKNCGYALRNYVTLQVMEEVVAKVFLDRK